MDRTNLKDHLLYFDITNICYLDCEFCMYQKERIKKPAVLELNFVAKNNIARLINSPDTDHIIISGEGDPFCNQKTLRSILNQSQGKRKFQIISNGAWKGGISRHLNMLGKMAQSQDDLYSIRLSLDSYHVPKVGSKVYQAFFKFFLENPIPNLSLAFRGIVSDKTYTREFIKRTLESLGINYDLKESSLLDDELEVNNTVFHINYKNFVHPHTVGRTDALPMNDYVKALEEKYYKCFTLGNLKTSGTHKGLDLTIKPDGNVFFYGAEIGSFGNIFRDQLTLNNFVEHVRVHPLINVLYTVPFSEILSNLRKIAGMSEKIDRINNPYWVIKELYSEHKNIMTKIIEPLR